MLSLSSLPSLPHTPCTPPVVVATDARLPPGVPVSLLAHFPRAPPAGVQLHGVLDDQFYYSGPLGDHYDAERDQHVISVWVTRAAAGLAPRLPPATPPAFPLHSAGGQPAARP